MKRSVPRLSAVAILLACSLGLPTVAASKVPPKPQARRYIAITVAGKVCPGIDKWSHERLFATKTKVDTLVPSKAFDRFCRYQWADANTLPDKPPAHDDLLRVDPDYDVLLPQGELSQDPGVRLALRDDFRTAYGLSTRTQPIYAAGSRTFARVALVDTAATFTPYSSAPANDKHGMAMAEIVHEVRCPGRDPGCRKDPASKVDRVFFVDAFPNVGEARAAVQGPPLPRPDNLGSLGSLAQAVASAVTQWRDTDTAHRLHTHLVLNMSLGWDPAWAPAAWAQPTSDLEWQKHVGLVLTPTQAVPATVQAVHAALTYASCFDVLMIAAAGNNNAGGCEKTGGMLPAKWEKLLAPSWDTCHTLFGNLAPRQVSHGPPVQRRALVYAVGARNTIYWNALPTAHFGGMPPRLLAGSHAVVGDQGGAPVTDAWTGSSVAAAAFSGLAANMWTHAPGLSSHQLMALIDSSGSATGAALGPLLTDGTSTEQPPGWTPPPNSVQIRTRDMFDAVCAEQATCGPNPYDQVAMPGPNVLTTAIHAATPGQLWPSSDRPLVKQSLPSACVFTRKHYFTTNKYIKQSTPPVASDDQVQPWTRPQPETPICPVCPVLDKLLHISLDSRQTSLLKQKDGKYVLENPLLEFRFPTGGFISVSLGDVPVDKGTLTLRLDLNKYRISVDGPPLPLGDALKAKNLLAGTLTIFVTDVNGNRNSLVSVVPVLD